MTVTVRDIAREAGVSAATVSRALARPDSVAPDTRQRVIEVAGRLGYVAAPSRRSDGRSATASIGLVVPDLDNPTFASLLKSAEQRCRVRGYAVLVGDCEKDAEIEADLVRDLSGRVDGLVICSPRSEPGTIAAFAEQVPLLVVDGHGEGLTSVTVDYTGGMDQVVTHLTALGHRQLAYAGGRTSTWSELERREGLRRALAERGLPEYVDLGAFTAGIAGGYAAADQLLATPATAIVCINTLVALGLINRLNQRGLSVPGDMSIVEFDTANTSRLASPLLTTVAPPPGTVGWTAADVMVQTIENPADTVNSRKIPVELSIQQSTGAPRSS
ncbi:LacI family transcriptional regulator [Kribbella aluminosa]|uniref:LacI family transcriptional regulator n=1 Tax=Kribbella aluminosa TaxID=416017 RepID=A0ABS4UJE1_9ACTN|nr:LacI family DNA-binding transcriptional regulator [Kribbella aluminosa]MBP2351671.1 LacI family transcriptional regulator [Kribbella aluminosa]